MLAAAENPLIWAGGGTISSGASDAVRKLAEHLQMPVIATAEGKGIISDRHPLSLGSLWLRNDTVAGEDSSHDLVLAVGTRAGLPLLVGRPTGYPDRRDSEELGRNFPTPSESRRRPGVAGALLAEVSKLAPARADRSAGSGGGTGAA